MSIDTFTTTALAAELTDVLVGGRVQDTVELDRESFGFEIYANRKRHYLLLSADNQAPRALIAPEKLRRGVQQPSTLGLLLRNRIEGLFLREIMQPPYERILIFDFVGEDIQLQLILEMITRRANLILTDGSLILECARRVGPQDNRYRIILPKHEYVPPPPLEGKIEPAYVTPDVIERLLRQHAKDKANTALTKGIVGFSPLLSREVVYRAYQSVDAKAADVNPYTLYAAYESIVPRLLRGDFQPGVVVDDDEMPTTIFVAELQHLNWQPTETVSDALNQLYGELKGEAAYEAARQPIYEQIKKARHRLNGRLVSLERENTDQSVVEHLRMSGELLLAYQYTLEPNQTLLEAQYEVDGDPLQIKIDPDMTPLENAQRYFERYEKKKRAVAQIPERIEETQQELDYLDQLELDLSMAENWNEIGEVQDALQRNGYWQGKKQAQPKGGKSGPHKATIGSFVVFVGRNARQNDQLLDRSEPYDLWMHVRGAPGSHVIIKTNAKPVPDEVLEAAASFAAYYSKKRSESKVNVMVAERRHVRKLKGGKPGQVLVHQERSTLLVEPAPVDSDDESE